MRTSGDSRFPTRPGKRLTLLIGVRDHYRHGSLETELLKRARHAKLAGGIVFEGDEGFGASGQIHRAHLASDDRPLAVVFVDESAKIDEFLDGIRPLLDGATVTIDEIEIVDL